MTVVFQDHVQGRCMSVTNSNTTINTKLTNPFSVSQYIQIEVSASIKFSDFVIKFLIRLYYFSHSKEDIKSS